MQRRPVGTEVETRQRTLMRLGLLLVLYFKKIISGTIYESLLFVLSGGVERLYVCSKSVQSPTGNFNEIYLAMVPKGVQVPRQGFNEIYLL
jgi:hypothetical protein